MLFRSTIGYRPSVPEWWQYPEPGYFDVEALYDAAGERVDSIKGVGTYTVEVVKGKAGLDRYATHHFEVADDFRVTRTVEILPATIGDSSQYTTPNGGKIYERMDSCAVWSATTLKYTIRPWPLSEKKFEYDGTSYPYTGNPVHPRFQVLDSTVSYDPSLRLLPPEGSDLSRFAFDPDDFEVTTVGYGTAGPTEVGSYTVSNVAAREGLPYLKGARKVRAYCRLR